MAKIINPLKKWRQSKPHQHSDQGAQQRALAAHVLNEVITNRRSLSSALRELVTNTQDHENLSISFIKELCFGTLRWYHELNPILNELLNKPIPKKNFAIHCLILTGLYQIHRLSTPNHAAVNETVNAATLLQAPWAKGLCNKILRKFIKQQKSLLNQAQQQAQALYAHPQWLIDTIKTAWPEQWEGILTNNNTPPPLFLRVNSNAISRDKYLNTLHQHHIEALATPSTPYGIQILTPTPVSNLPGFKEGLFSVQDISGQKIIDLLDLAPQLTVLDACAAPGSKTCHILESEPLVKKLVAIDKDSERLLMIKQNMQRLKLSNQHLRLTLADANHTKEWWDGDLFDRILLDAPCLATGVIRRHPDIKILKQPEDITSICKQQHYLLHQLWPLLKPQGKLIYSTCSILPQENEEQINAFLKAHPNAKTVKIEVPGTLRLKHGNQAFPKENEGDGFYYCVLTKTK